MKGDQEERVYREGCLNERDEKAELARAMRDEGKTLQQIADELGYKSATSVLNLLNK